MGKKSLTVMEITDVESIAVAKAVPAMEKYRASLYTRYTLGPRIPRIRPDMPGLFLKGLTVDGDTFKSWRAKADQHGYENEDLRIRMDHEWQFVQPSMRPCFICEADKFAKALMDQKDW